jgi:hypothetical protein
MSNKKSQFLGIPHGTAVARLRKSILFSLVRRLNEDYCFRCSNKIDDVKDLSIEHKQPWENISVELFWDLDNIAFSHLKCNVPHKRRGGGGTNNRNIAPEGFAWCAKHKDFIPTNNFTNGNRWDGFNDYCNDCRKLLNGRKIT